MQPKRTLKPKLRTTLPRSLYQATQTSFHGKTAPRCVTVRASGEAKPFKVPERNSLHLPPSTTRGQPPNYFARCTGKCYRNNQNQSQTHFGAFPVLAAQRPLSGRHKLGDQDALSQKFVQQADGSEREHKNGAAVLDRRKTKARGKEKRDYREAVAH